MRQCCMHEHGMHVCQDQPGSHRPPQAARTARQMQTFQNARLPRSAKQLLPLPAGSAHGLDGGSGPAHHSQDSPVKGTAPLGTLRHHFSRLFSRDVTREPSLRPASVQHQRQEAHEAASDDEWAGGQSDTAARSQGDPLSAPAGHRGSSAASARLAGPLQQPDSPSTAAAASSRQQGGVQRPAPDSGATSPQHQLDRCEQQQQAEGGQGSSTRRADMWHHGHHVVRSAGPSEAGSLIVKRGADSLQQRQHPSQPYDLQQRQQQLPVEQADRPADQLLGMLRRLEATLSIEEPATIEAADADEQQPKAPAGRMRRTSSTGTDAGQAPTAMATALAISLPASRNMASRMADLASAAEPGFAARQ